MHSSSIFVTPFLSLFAALIHLASPCMLRLSGVAGRFPFT
jgi:hypothetical protein